MEKGAYDTRSVMDHPPNDKGDKLLDKEASQSRKEEGILRAVADASHVVAVFADGFGHGFGHGFTYGGGDDGGGDDGHEGRMEAVEQKEAKKLFPKDTMVILGPQEPLSPLDAPSSFDEYFSALCPFAVGGDVTALGASSRNANACFRIGAGLVGTTEGHQDKEDEEGREAAMMEPLLSMESDASDVEGESQSPEKVLTQRERIAMYTCEGGSSEESVDDDSDSDDDSDAEGEEESDEEESNGEDSADEGDDPALGYVDLYNSGDDHDHYHDGKSKDEGFDSWIDGSDTFLPSEISGSGDDAVNFFELANVDDNGNNNDAAIQFSFDTVPSNTVMNTLGATLDAAGAETDLFDSAVTDGWAAAFPSTLLTTTLNTNQGNKISGDEVDPTKEKSKGGVKDDPTLSLSVTPKLKPKSKPLFKIPPPPPEKLRKWEESRRAGGGDGAAVGVESTIATDGGEGM